MNRRDSLKALGLTAVSTGVLLNACNTNENKTGAAVATEVEGAHRQPDGGGAGRGGRYGV